MTLKVSHAHHMPKDLAQFQLRQLLSDKPLIQIECMWYMLNIFY